MQRKVFKPYLLTYAPAWSHVTSSKPAFSRSCCITSICQFKFDQQKSNGANDQAKLLQFAVFCDHGWGHVAVYPK